MTMPKLPPLGPGQFGEFFKVVYGYEPFPWQEKLARRVAGAERNATAKPWPDVAALPTASGKTKCIDIAVFALACQAHWPAEKRTAARRIFFVVDRRVIVDQAFEDARKLAHKLRNATDKDGVLKIIADRLRYLADPSGSLTSGDSAADPLACFQLRGGIYRDDAWARTPLQPTVLASTVDQIGSRLLFRGYGLRGGSLWPVHAGLAANDSLILLDEAHCARPFEETLRAIQKYRAWAQDENTDFKTPFHVMVMSATPAEEDNDQSVKPEILRLEVADRNCEELRKRLSAAKPTRLVEVKKAKGEESKALTELAEELFQQAKRFEEDDSQTFKSIGILVNRVATARQVYQHLCALPKSGQDTGREVLLLTGRMRPIDRDRLMEEWRPRGADKNEKPGLLEWLGASREAEERRNKLNRPIFVVATQCLEVGANLDFDALVSECASLDALRQRFGRLNRLGRPIDARGVIVIRVDQTKPKEEEQDPIYGNALPHTWLWLNQNADPPVCDKDEPRIDMGVDALDKLLSEKPWENSLQAETEHAPVMLPAHVDCWSQTAPVPCPDPDVALFLHGPQRSSPDVQVCWRADLDPKSEKATKDEWQNAVALCPPASIECMPVPLHALRKWLLNATDTPKMPDTSETDVEGARATDEPDEDETPRQYRGPVLCWRGAEDSILIDGPQNFRKLRPGDVIVVPAALRGWNELGHVPDIPDESNRIDAGDEAQRRARRKAVLRLHPALLEGGADGPAKARLLELAQADDFSNDFESRRELGECLETLARTRDCPEWFQVAAKRLAIDLKRRRTGVIFAHPFGGLALQSARLLKPAPNQQGEEDLTFTNEDDSASATVRVSLDDHLGGVEAWTRRFANGCGLPESLITALTLAARLHDFGKADPRFQAWLYGGLRASGELLAKSGGLPQGRAQREAARRRSGYPQGGRHELLSVCLAEKTRELQELRKLVPERYELVLHLIASHHGRCRPFAPVIDDPASEKTTATCHGVTAKASEATVLARLDSGVAERFWRVVRQYGWWTLAYLEAILRLADMGCSAAEQNRKEKEEDREEQREEKPQLAEAAS